MQRTNERTIIKLMTPNEGLTILTDEDRNFLTKMLNDPSVFARPGTDQYRLLKFLIDNSHKLLSEIQLISFYEIKSYEDITKLAYSKERKHRKEYKKAKERCFHSIYIIITKLEEYSASYTLKKLKLIFNKDDQVYKIVINDTQSSDEVPTVGILSEETDLDVHSEASPSNVSNLIHYILIIKSFKLRPFLITIFIVILLFFLMYGFLHHYPIYKTWSSKFELNGMDRVFSILPIKNGGYILAVESWGPFKGNDGDVTLIKLDDNGKQLWKSAIFNNELKHSATFLLGESGIKGSNESQSTGMIRYIEPQYESSSLFQTIDGGYIIGGSATRYFDYLKSNNTNLSKKHNDMEILGYKILSNWLAKVDMNGKIDWLIKLGECDQSERSSFAKNNNRRELNKKALSFDLQLPNLANKGNIILVNSPISIKHPISAIQTKDMGYIVVETYQVQYSTVNIYHDSKSISNLMAIALEHGTVIKLDKSGNILWKRSFKGNKTRAPISIIQDKEDQYLIVGLAQLSNNKGGDAWVAKINENGDTVWERIFGGYGFDWAEDIILTDDNGCIVMGGTNSFGNGSYDAWLIKLDSLGNRVWEKTFGGIYEDKSNSITKSWDGGYLIGGYSSSEHGKVSNWIFKIDNYGKMEWERSFGENIIDKVTSINTTIDKGIAIAGYSIYWDNNKLHQIGSSCKLIDKGYSPYIYYNNIINSISRIINIRNESNNIKEPSWLQRGNGFFKDQKELVIYAVGVADKIRSPEQELKAVNFRAQQELFDKIGDYNIHKNTDKDDSKYEPQNIIYYFKRVSSFVVDDKKANGSNSSTIKSAAERKSPIMVQIVKHWRSQNGTLYAQSRLNYEEIAKANLDGHSFHYSIEFDYTDDILNDISRELYDFKRLLKK
jgi:hypothetical protein